MDPLEVMSRMHQKGLFKGQMPTKASAAPAGIGVNPDLPYYVDVSPMEKAVRVSETVLEECSRLCKDSDVLPMAENVGVTRMVTEGLSGE